MTPQHIRIGIVVEGDTERRLFDQRRCWFQGRGLEPKVAQANGRERLIQDARHHLELMRLRGCQCTFFLLDQHDDPCPPGVARLLQDVLKEGDAVACVMV